MRSNKFEPATIPAPDPVHHCDILVVGAGAGGSAAALAAAEAGSDVCLIEDGDWPGGQLTTMSVLDEPQELEKYGGTKRYYAFRNAVRAYYRSVYRVRSDAESSGPLNPGAAWNGLAYEPKVGVTALKSMFSSSEAAGHLHVYYRTHVVRCEMGGPSSERVETVIARDANNHSLQFKPRFVLDGTETGELLKVCGSEGQDWVMGAESKAQTGEPDAPAFAHRDWVQPITVPVAIGWSGATMATNPIAAPNGYEVNRVRQPYRIGQGGISSMFSGGLPWWPYRRILAVSKFADSRVPTDVILVNTNSNDYLGGNLLSGVEADAERTAESARLASLGYVYWLQHECPREGTEKPDNNAKCEPIATKKLRGQRYGYPEMRLRPDIYDTQDGCAPHPYVREGRRIRSLRAIKEQEIVVRGFAGKVCRGSKARAELMPDSVGLGHFALDIHANGRGERDAFSPTRPFQIPLGALIPKRWSNLLPAGKCLGTTHLTNGAYRLHPIEWNIGESAGLLAAWCVEHNKVPRELYASVRDVHALQQLLLHNGIPIFWFSDLPANHPANEAAQMLACVGVPVAGEFDLQFHPNDLISARDWQTWRSSFGVLSPKWFNGTRAQAAILIYKSLPRLEERIAPCGSNWVARLLTASRQASTPKLPRPLLTAYQEAPCSLVQAALVRMAPFHGWPYKLGGKAYRSDRATGIDCSGLAAKAYPSLAGTRGNELDARTQFERATAHGKRVVKRHELQTGDLIFFRPTRQWMMRAEAKKKPCHWHVGIVLHRDGNTITYYNSHDAGGVSVSVLPAGQNGIGSAVVLAGGARPPHP